MIDCECYFLRFCSIHLADIEASLAAAAMVRRLCIHNSRLPISSWCQPGKLMVVYQFHLGYARRLTITVSGSNIHQSRVEMLFIKISYISPCTLYSNDTAAAKHHDTDK